MTQFTFLTKAQRAMLIDEYIECAYFVDEDYTEKDEVEDREWLTKLDNVTFMEEITALMPDASI